MGRRSFVSGITSLHKAYGRLAQLVEHQSYTLGVVGSSPAPPTKNSFLGSSVGRAHDC